MIHPLDEVPEYIEQEVWNRIGAGGNGSTLIVDESEEELLLGYTGFTNALKREYKNACEERGEDTIKIYQITMNNSGVQVTRFESANGSNTEKIWREGTQ